MAKKSSTRKRTTKAARPGDDVTKSPRLPTPGAIGLDQVLGQPRAVSVVQRALDSGRVHHAWLLHGPAGVGKFTTALAMAGVLLDPEAGPDLAGRFAADPESRVQKLVRGGGHPELQVIRKELSAFHPNPDERKSKQRGISKRVTEHFLIEPAAKTASLPGGLAGKVFIVDEADLMNTASQNAILKTLEEPPEGTVLFLVTSSEDRLLPTIRSRCQRVGFGPLDEGSMRRWLVASKLPIEPREEAWLLGFAAGSPGVLQSAHESRLYDWWNQLEPMLDDAAGGRAPAALGSVMAGLVDSWSSEWVKGGEKGLEVRSKESANRAGMRRMLSLVGYHAQRRMPDERSQAWAVQAVQAIGRAESLAARQVQAAFALEGLAGDLAVPPMGDLASV
ncbi:MAG: DNA polymerase-3 subunit delta' [Phycisphaerales bacterium]|jgi:DNA polymerase-3 subunit delta'